MLTIFTAAKPFRERMASIQRNALQSWSLLHREVQIILFGDAAGSQEISWEFGIHHEAHPQLTPCGAVRLDDMLATARRLARYNTLCYVACDVILLPDFCEALNRVEALYPEFVMAGRSRDVQLSEPFPFEDLEWEMQSPSCEKWEQPAQWDERIAYVAFSRNLFVNDIPPLPANDPSSVKWLLGKALADEAVVVDASEVVVAFRQRNETKRAAREENETEAQARATPGVRRRLLQCVASAPFRLTAADVVRNRWQRVRQWQERVLMDRTGS
jgi:hypothetical protein